MKPFNLFVEGSTDKEFFNALLARHFQIDQPHITILKGDHTRLKEHSDRLKDGKINLIILDADVNSETEINKSLKPIIQEEALANRKVIFHIFLLEKNLEDVIRRITPEEKAPIWNCIDLYADCIASSKRDDLRPLNNKTKVYIYVNAHEVPENFKNKTFHNPAIWNLNHPSLDPLIHFLKTHLS